MRAEKKAAISTLKPNIPITFLLIFMLGAFLRLYTLGDVLHGSDEAYPAYDALRLIEGGQLILRGQPSSVFLDNPPLMSYIQAVPLLIWRSVWAPSVLVTLLNTLAIAFVFRAGRDSLGAQTGLLAALLFAINPWVIFFSRPTWVQGLVPFFMSVIAWGLLPALRTSAVGRGLSPVSDRRVLIGGLALVALCGTYVQAWGVLASVVPIVLIFNRRLPRRPLLIAAVVLLVGVLAYTLTLALDWQANVAKLTAYSGSAGQFTLSGLNHAVRFVTGLESETIRDWQGIGGQGWRGGASLAAHALLLLALIGGVGRALWVVVRRSEGWRVAVALLIWFGVPVLLTSYSAYPIHPHYLMISQPAGHILAGWGIAGLLNVAAGPQLPARSVVKALCVILLAAITLVFTLNIRATGQYASSMPMTTNFNGWGLAENARLGATIRALTEGQPAPRRVAATGTAYNLSSIAATYLDVHEGLDYPNFVILPGDEPMLYILANREVAPGALGPHEETFPDLGMDPAVGVRVEFVRVRPYTREQALALPANAVDWPSDAGLTLLGYTVSQDAGAIHVETYWRVEELRPERAGWFVTAFHHLLADDGTEIANVGGPGEWGFRWRIGDVYVERAVVPVPPDFASGTYELAVGLFDPIHNLNFLMSSPDGPVSAIIIPIRLSD